jgi:hypothetical protein
VAYGWYHRRSLQAEHDKHKLENAAHHREQLIAQAKEAWKRKQESANDAREQCSYVYDPITFMSFPLYKFSMVAIENTLLMLPISCDRPRGSPLRPRKADSQVCKQLMNNLYRIQYCPSIDCFDIYWTAL